MSKTALITGGTNGIGKEFAYQLAKQGYNIVIVGRNNKRGLKVANDIKQTYGVDCQMIVSDLSTQEGINNVVDFIDSTKDLSIVVNGAGFLHMKNFLDEDLNKWSEMITVHNLALMKICYAAGNKFKKSHQKGRIINISSIASFLRAGNPLYAGTKSFVRFFSLNLHEELKKDGIYIQALCPGSVDTALWDNSLGYAPKLGQIRIEKVVSQSLKSHKKIVIPGVINKIIVFFMKIIPGSFIYKASKWIIRI